MRVISNEEGSMSKNDPTRDELEVFLHNEFSLDDPFDMQEAIYWFAYAHALRNRATA
jgi:hypothetical protein